ncbi:MAG TPA: SDR family NAD(P)-dependent oxidoreductase [Candidatus Paceibacterota bacterium]
MKIVCITGISRGIGKALAHKFINEGYFVIGTSITGDVDFGRDNLKLFKLDLLEPKSIKECASGIEKLLSMDSNDNSKKIDIHINNAGALFDEGENTVVIDKLRKTLEVNLIGPIDFTERILPLINNGGHIVNISSSAGSLEKVHHADYPAYKISKCALNMFTTYLAFRLKNKITVSSIHPGRVKTDMGAWKGDMTTDESAKYIFDTAIDKNIETGQFWYKREKFPW